MLELGMSDVCHGWPGIGPYTATQAAHIALGMAAGVLPLIGRRAVLAGFTGLGVWIGKEIFGDIARCHHSVWVPLDSAADLGFAGMGFALVQWTLARARAGI